MVLKFLKRILIYGMFTLCISGTVRAQVTIGSGNPPVKGALLDLKESNYSDGTTAKKGLGMPRVGIISPAQLELEDYNGATLDKNEHIGLLVFNVNQKDGNAITSRKDMVCPGLHVWDGVTWQPLIPYPEKGLTCIPTIYPPATISGASPLYFVSGQNLDGNPVDAPVNLTWTPTSSTVTMRKSDVNVNGKTLPQIVFSTEPTVIIPAGGTDTYTLSVAPMTAAEVDANPFKTKAVELAFTVLNENDEPAIFRAMVYQTNKALTVDTKVKPDLIKNPADGVLANHTIASNARWKLTGIEPNDGSQVFGDDLKIGSTALTIGTEFGQELYNGTAESLNLTYTTRSIKPGTKATDINKLTFSDAGIPKRFNDVVISVTRCNNDVPMPMSKLAAIAGFSEVAEIKISDADDIAKKIDTPNTVTGIAWHRDQDGNVFLSASFDSNNVTGDNERWMITNLAAKSFAETGRTGDDNVKRKDFDTSVPAISSTVTLDPFWTYPNGGTGGGADPTTFNLNPRAGLLYNWQAATNSRVVGSDIDIQVSNGEEDATIFPIDPQTERVQGICPNGWHLPSDTEWSRLEFELSDQAMTYSHATENVGSSHIAIGSVAQRGLLSNANGHGNVMIEICEPGRDANTVALSTPISTIKRPGFETIFAGMAVSGALLPTNYGMAVSFWSATAEEGQSINRITTMAASGVSRNLSPRNHMYSIRCKKD